ncbi:flagellar protein FliT [Hahella sp. HN01]|uniref:flagellar protein FliT n=1 Tax=unclassified Hahella TaxID=2624107 RepID=UPI001C1F018A|nr:flagellar protein FliT [Hahella sp. HN01]MBU6949887.1 flagellar protein FliT [Hahella sp. HN01]
MSQLEKLAEQIEQLASQSKWDELIALEPALRDVVQESVAQTSEDDKPQLIATLTRLRSIYANAVQHAGSNRSESAQELTSVRRSLKAAQSYLNTSKF